MMRLGLLMRQRLLFVVLLCAFACVLSVDRNKFRRCVDTAFCKRHRLDGGVDGPSLYAVDHATVQVSGGALTADILHNVHPLRDALQLRVALLAVGAVRITVNERAPLFPRYEVADVLTHDATALATAEWQKTDNRHGSAVGSWSYVDALNGSLSAMSVSVSYNPLRVVLSRNGQVVSTWNARNGLRFEPYRQRNARPAPPTPPTPAALPDGTIPPTPPAEVVADPPANSVKYEYDTDGMWEESFGGHTDRKARGPASVSADVTFADSAHIYGLPEHATSFTLRGTYQQKDGEYSEPYRLYNLDVFEYELNEPMSLYGAVPYVVSHTPHQSSGALWLNAAETFVDVLHNAVGGGLLTSARESTNVHWISESGIVDTFLLVGPSPQTLAYQYAMLTGFQALPPRFAIAYHQCRWNYKSEEDVRTVDGGFDEWDIPYDVLWLDIEHTDGKKYFTWDSHNFPTPIAMQDALATRGRKMVTIVDPHIKRDAAYSIHTAAQEKDLYVKNNADGVYEGWCWPGSVSYLDFLLPNVRAFWADAFAIDRYTGSTHNLYIWNDMNE